MTLSPGKNIRIFKNPVMEQFTYVHPVMPIALWGTVSGYCFAAGLLAGEIDLMISLALAAIGAFFWTFAEYFLHRFVFHFNARTPLQERIAFLIHGVHHDDPDDARRLLMPPVAAIVFALFFYAIFAVCLGPVYCKPLFAGFLWGYLVYDYTHFAVHFIKPRGKIMKSLKQNHMLHHYATPDKRFGVSNTLWDHVFGTRGQ